MTGRSGNVLGYNALRQLISWQNQATNPTQTASYAYNGSGERVQQSVTSGGATTITSYIGSYEDIATTGGTTTTTKYYQMGKVGTAEAVNGTLYYQIADDLGSVSATLTASGGVQATELYDPFGYVRYTNGTMPTSYGFTKMRQDPSGLNYDHARYYDASVGQFVTADYVQGPNRYAYVGGNPETTTDPSGNCFPLCLVTAIVGGVAGAVVGGVAAYNAIKHGANPVAAIGHALVDTALGAGAGFLAGSTPGGAAGLVTSIAATVITGVATGGKNLNNPAALQQTFESIALGTIAGAASGAIGGKLASGITQFAEGTAARGGASALAVIGNTLANGALNVVMDGAAHGLTAIDGPTFSWDWGREGSIFGLGAASGLVSSLAFYKPMLNNPINGQIVTGILGGGTTAVTTAGSNVVDSQMDGKRQNSNPAVSGSGRSFRTTAF